MSNLPKERTVNIKFKGLGIGTVIACLLSWHTNHSVLWLLFHGCFGWLYVIYNLCKYHL